MERMNPIKDKDQKAFNRVFTKTKRRQYNEEKVKCLMFVYAIFFLLKLT